LIEGAVDELSLEILVQHDEARFDLIQYLHHHVGRSWHSLLCDLRYIFCAVDGCADDMLSDLRAEANKT
jgi:hypothetical protein